MLWPFDLMMLSYHSTSCRGGMRRESGKLGLPLNWYTATPPTILLSSDHPHRPMELAHQSRRISYLQCKPASLQSAGSSAYLRPLTCCWQLFYGLYSSRLVKWEQLHNTLTLILGSKPNPFTLTITQTWTLTPTLTLTWILILSLSLIPTPTLI